MSKKIIESLAWSDALCKPDQTIAYIHSHSVHWQSRLPASQNTSDIGVRK